MAKILEHLSTNNGAYIKKLGELLEAEEKVLEGKKSVITKETVETEMKEGDQKSSSHYENLSLIFAIFKNLFHIADQGMLEMLVSDELMMISFGALECNKNL